MKTIVLVPNTARDTGYRYTKELIAAIGGRAVVRMAKQHSVVGGGAEYVEERELFLHADVAVALGGDGTILAAAGEVSRYHVPVLGINLGHLGFLAEVEPPYMQYAAERLLADEFTVEERFMLRADVLRGGEQVRTFHALNDIVVSRAIVFAPARPADACWHAPARLLCRRRCDFVDADRLHGVFALGGGADSGPVFRGDSRYAGMPAHDAHAPDGAALVRRRGGRAGGRA